MNTLSNTPIQQHYERLLAGGGQAHAWGVVQAFFHLYDKDSPREYLWYLLVQSLTNEKTETDATDRSNLLCFYEYCALLFKAVELLHDAQQPAKPTQP